MISQIIADIYELTLEIESSLDQENIDQIEPLLEKRGKMMAKVEALKLESPEYQYTVAEQNMLQATFQLDQLLIPKMEELKTEAGKKLNQLKLKQQVSKKYSPYQQQNYGAFIDTNK